MNRRLAGSICGVLSFLFILTSGDGITAHGQCAPPAIPYPDSAVHSHNAAVGQDVTFYVGPVQGTPPLYYQWKFNGVPVDGATNTWVTITNVQFANAGYYSVLASNACGIRESFTNDSALGGRLTVGYAASILVPPRDQNVVTGQTATFSFIPGGTPPFTNNWYSFGAGYGINGTNTSFSLANVRIGYAGPVYLTCSNAFGGTNAMATLLVSIAPILPNRGLTATTAGGGSVSVNPPGGSYIHGTLVTVTATPSVGWTFLNWLGDASGTNPVFNLTMDRNKNVEAVFATTLSTTVAGSGSVSEYPASAIYPYGSTVRLTALPQPGNYFGVWGNAASGNTNPLFFSITAPTQTISSLFASLASNQVSLTVALDGFGQVNASPPAIVYANGASVTLTAVPDNDQSFLGWSGDASSAANPLAVTMNQSKLITATFTRSPNLSVVPDLDGLTSESFRFSLTGEWGAIYEIKGSSNLLTWFSVGLLTNSYGTSEFSDPSATNADHRFYRAAGFPSSVAPPGYLVSW